MNELSRRLAEPLDAPGHSELRTEMCDSRLLGRDGALRYFVSVLTGIDCLGHRSEELPSIVEKLAKDLIGEAAEHYVFNDESILWMGPLFESEYRKRYEGLGLERKWTKEDEAVVCRLRHPLLSDIEIAKLTPTTVKQLEDFSHYKYLRRFMRTETSGAADQ